MRSPRTLAPMLTIAAALLCGAAVPGAAMAKEKPAKASKEAPADGMDLSDAVRTNVVEVQTAIEAGDYATARTKLAAVDAAVTTADDRYAASSLRIQIAQKTNDTVLGCQAADELLGMNRLTGTNLQALLGRQGNCALEAKDWAKAERSFSQLQTLEPGNAQIADTVTKLRRNIAISGENIDAQLAAGQVPAEIGLRNNFAKAYEARDLAGVEKWGKLWVGNYPSKANWRALIAAHRQLTNPDEAVNVDLMRLARATGSLEGERDYFDYAKYAYNRGLPGEAKAVLDEGFNSGALTSSSQAASEVRGLASGQVAADRASLAGFGRDARNARDGVPAQRTADAYLGYGEYDQAIELYQLALQKGGADANLVNTRLGIALARAGRKDEAKRALAAVTGPRAPIAGYWSMWVDKGA